MEDSAIEFGGINVEFREVNKSGIASTFCHVEMLNNKKSIDFKEFISKIKKLDLDNEVKKTSINVFTRIAEAEAKVHGKSLDEIHFHEVGASDAVADVVGSVYAYYSLNLDKESVIGLPISVGGGNVKTSHGMLTAFLSVIISSM